MFSQLNYQKKTYILASLFAFALLLGYQLSFKKTYDAYSQIQYYENGNLNASAIDIHGLKKRFEALDSIHRQIRGIEYERLMIQKIGEILNKYEVELFHLGAEGSFDSDLNVVTLQGSFHRLCGALYDLETTFFAGRVISSEFSLISDKKNGVRILNLRIHLEKILKDEKGN